MKNRETMAWEYFVFDLIIQNMYERCSFFYEKLGENDMRALFFVGGDVIITKYGHGASGFSWKIGKKGIRAVCFCQSEHLYSKIWAWEP